MRSDNSSGITGVIAYTRKCGMVSYLAYITVAGKRINLGTHKTLEEAAKARKAGEEKYFIPITDANK